MGQSALPQQPLTFANAAKFKNFSAANAGAQIKTGSGVLVGLQVNTLASGATITLYDGVDTTGPVIGEWSAAALGQFNMPPIGVGFATGLFAVITDAPNVTVFYR